MRVHCSPCRPVRGGGLSGVTVVKGGWFFDLWTLSGAAGIVEGMSEIHLLAEPGEQDGAALTFDAVLAAIESARVSIEIFMFVWRNDEIGNAVGQALLEAAERGVDVRIFKDRGAIMFERLEMNGKSFLRHPVPLGTRIGYWVSGLTFPDTRCSDEFGDDLSEALISHPAVSVQWVDHTHTKYYIFDDTRMLLGSINIEDRHRGYRDTMIALNGAEFVERFRARASGDAGLEAGRPFDFVQNRHGVFEIKAEMLRLLDAVKSRVYVEMAYIGDEDITDKLVELSARGVEITLLFSREANIGDDINYKTLRELYVRAKVAVYLSDQMVHAKLMILDDEVVILGSANLSVFSLQQADELSVIIRDNPIFVDQLQAVCASRLAVATRVTSLDEVSGYNRVIAFLQQLHQKLSHVLN